LRHFDVIRFAQKACSNIYILRLMREQIDTEYYFGLWNSAQERIAAHLGHSVYLEIEPGSFLMAEAGVLMAEVRGKGHGYPILYTGGRLV
jgi:diaminopimelate decarboxylase